MCIRDRGEAEREVHACFAKKGTVETDGVDQQDCRNGQSFPRPHGTGDTLPLVFTPSRVPEMDAKRTVEKGGEDVGQKLNYNVGHSQILLEAHPPCSIT